jgi:hypothetical protein
MQRYLTRKQTLRAVRRVLRDPTHPAWLGAWKRMIEHASDPPEPQQRGPTLAELIEMSMRRERARRSD